MPDRRSCPYLPLSTLLWYHDTRGGRFPSPRMSEIQAMKRVVCLLSVVVAGAFAMTLVASAASVEKASTPLNQTMKTLDGQDVNLADKYQGKVVLLVNVASKCGNTPQYKPLEGLHEKYAEKGLAIVGVPCNQFGGQEPGTAADITEFCTKNYGVKFDMLSKVDVNGDDACPLYKSLTSKESDPKFAGKINWNFEKFLFDRKGQLVARFAPKTQPDSLEVVTAIETELAK
jgi:glutathione peroxidase